MKQASGARNQRLAKRVVAASGASKAERKDAEREDAEIHGLVMQELDADHDGMLSMAELDRNGDGVLDADELMAAGISVAKQRMLDTNNDGHLSFSELDLNGDGILDADELEAARKSVPRLNKCYDFAWSRELWAQAAVFIQRVILVTAIIYLIIVVTVTYADGYRGADIPYSISQALLTVSAFCDQFFFCQCGPVKIVHSFLSIAVCALRRFNHASRRLDSGTRHRRARWLVASSFSQFLLGWS